MHQLSMEHFKVAKEFLIFLRTGHVSSNKTSSKMFPVQLKESQEGHEAWSSMPLLSPSSVETVNKGHSFLKSLIIKLLNKHLKINN